MFLKNKKIQHNLDFSKVKNLILAHFTFAFHFFSVSVIAALVDSPLTSVTALLSLCSVFDCFQVDIWSHLLTIAAKNTPGQQIESVRSDQTTDRGLSEVHSSLHNKQTSTATVFFQQIMD